MQCNHRSKALEGRRGIVRQHRFDFDLFAEGRSQQPRGIDDQGVDVGVARLQRLSSAEGQQMPRQIGPPRGGGADHIGDLDEMRTILDRIGGPVLLARAVAEAPPGKLSTTPIDIFCKTPIRFALNPGACTEAAKRVRL